MSHPVFGAMRLQKHGKIEETGQFALDREKPFSLFLKPKTEDFESVVLLDVALAEDDVHTPMPFVVGSWSEGLVSRVYSIDAPLLAAFDIYWAH